MCVYVCVRMCSRARARMCVCLPARARVCLCVHSCIQCLANACVYRQTRIRGLLSSLLSTRSSSLGTSSRSSKTPVSEPLTSEVQTFRPFTDPLVCRVGGDSREQLGQCLLLHRTLSQAQSVLQISEGLSERLSNVNRFCTSHFKNKTKQNSSADDHGDAVISPLSHRHFGSYRICKLLDI